jgi:epsin
LLEFLIKNGSERVIDDARSHLSLIKMLKQFHFIDQAGKDQGINVRNRSKELVDMLSDVDKIRGERKKAKANKTKYAGYEGGGGSSGFNGSGASGSGSGSGRYGGFGSETAGYGGYDGRVYGDGGGFGGASSSDYQDTQARRDRFEEYDEFEDGGATRKKPNSPVASSAGVKREGKKVEASVKAKQPQVDLFSFDDEPAPAPVGSSGKAPATLSGLGDFGPAATDDDDEFDDFQSAPAPSAPAPISSNKPFALAAPIGSTLAKPAAPSNDFFSPVSPPPTSGASSGFVSPAPVPRQNISVNYQPSQPNYFTSVSAGSVASPLTASRPSVATTPGALGKPLAPTGGAAAKPAGDAFAGLLSGLGGPKKDANVGKQGSTMADLARQKASAGIWGAGSSGGAPSFGGPAAGAAGKPAVGQKLGGGLDDLLG